VAGFPRLSATHAARPRFVDSSSAVWYTWFDRMTRTSHPFPIAHTLLIGLVALAAAMPASAQNERAGTTVFQFVRIGIAARPMGMGGAFTAVADDPHAIQWNPAGLAFVRFPEGTTSYMSYFAGVDAGAVSFVQPVGKMAGFAFAASYLRVGGLQTTTTANRTGDGLSTFSANDLALSVAFGGRVAERLFFGMTGSFLYEGITAFEGFSTTAGSFDAGLLYKTGFHGLTGGLALRHFGSQFALYQATSERLPLTIAGGVSARPFTRRLLVAVEVEKPRDNDVGVNAGAEYQIVRDFFVRSGYRSLDARIGNDAVNGDLAGLTFGIGIAGDRRYKVDYAFTSLADLGDVHRITLAVTFR